MNKYKVSVILPSLNVANYIEECIQSVLNQSLTDIEIICVDAGSTDGTWEILEQYKKNPMYSSKIRLYKSERKSYGYQVNLGIKNAVGEYIGIVETDDYVSSDMYEILYNAAIEESVDYIKSNYKRYWTTSGLSRVFNESDILKNVDIEYREVIDADKYQKVLQCDTNVWNGIYRRSFLIDNGIYFNETAGAAFQDIGFLQHVHWNANRVIFLEDALYIYCTDRDDSSTNNGNGLKYAYQEYSRLTMEVKQLTDNKKEALYERMHEVFLVQYQDSVSKNLIEDNQTYIDWFLDILKCSGRIIRQEELEIIVEKIDKKTEQEESFLKALPTDRNIILFGSGVRGKKGYRFLDRHLYDVIGFADNNSCVWNTKIGDVYVKNPLDYITENPNCVWIIANRYSYEDIIKQLLSYCISKENIYVWDV